MTIIARLSGHLRRREPFYLPLALFLFLRLLTEITVLVATHNAPVQPPEWIYYNPTGATYTITLAPDAPLYNLLAPWHRYDTLWYTKNALQGYLADDPGIAFLPLYSILIRLVVVFCNGNYVLAALLVSNVCCLLVFVLFYQLIMIEWKDRGLARRALICLVAFPTSYYLLAGYSESLFLALVIGAFVLALRQQWVWVGLLAFLIALTRLQGFVVALPLTCLAYVRFRPTHIRGWLIRSTIILGAAAGIGLYFGYLNLHHLSLATVYTTEWKSWMNWPWSSVQTYLVRLFNSQTFGYENNNALALIVFALLTLYVLLRLPRAYALYTVSTLVIFLMRYYETSQLESMTRYVLQLFPCFIAAGMLLRRRVVLIGYTSLALAAQVILLSRFTLWIWVA